MAAVLSAGALLGWHGYHPAQPPEGEYLLRGTVVQLPALEADGQLQSVLTDVTLDGQPCGSAYWTCYLDEGETPPDWLVPGAAIETNVKVYHPNGLENPGGFHFQEYLLQRGIRYGVYGTGELRLTEGGFSLSGWIARVRHGLSQRLIAVMGDETGSYASAMLLGTRDFIPTDDRAAFNDLGIAHILSVSGYHVGVLVSLLFFFTRPLPLHRRSRFLLEALALAAYCLLTGGSAPVIRASLLLLWREFTHQQHRQILPLHALCTTALIQLFFNPTLLTSPSFQLTYCAMLGLMLIRPWLKRRVSLRSASGQRLWEAFSTSLSVHLGLLMPQLYWFGELPLLSIVLNMAVMALAGGLMALYWLTLLCLPIPFLREGLGALSALATQGMLACVRYLAAQDFTTLWTRQADVFTFAGWVLLLVSASHLLPRKLHRHRSRLLMLGSLMLALILLPLPQHSTSFTMFSVGNADASLLQDQDVTVVIDTGEDGQALASRLHQQRQSVEMLIITHLHTDHAGGLRALMDQGIPVEHCYLPADAGIPVIDEEVLPLLDELVLTGTRIHFLSRGDVLALPSGHLTVLWPPAGRVSALHDANEMNLVLQAEIGGVTMLLTGDLPGIYEHYITQPNDILKAAHHGSRDANTPAFLSSVDPRLILVSNRLSSREDHMREAAGEIPLYTTDSCGAVTIRFLGNGHFTVSTMK